MPRQRCLIYRKGRSAAPAAERRSVRYPAAKAELQNDDVIVRINEKDVEDLEAFTKIYDDSVKNKDATVLVDFKRRRSSQQTVLKVTYAP